MTEEANKIVKALRICTVSGFRCEDCPVHIPAKACPNLMAANLIESLSSELELARQENTGLSIMLTAAQSAAETFRRERDALLADLREADMTMCNHCAYFVTSGTQGKCDGYCWRCGCEDCPCNTCDDNSNWKWRGVQECE